MGFIRLANNKGIAVFDADDVDLVGQYLWYYSHGYALNRSRARGNIFMHRLVLGYDGDMDIDHRNKDRLDNRKSNLRIVSRTENNYNRLANRDALSQYKGVNWSKAAGKWEAQIQYRKTRYYLGLFESEENAAKAYDRKAIELGIDHLYLNFPRQEVT